MDYEEMKSTMAEFCDNVSYDKTRDWRSDSRTAEDPDDANEVQAVKPTLTFEPRVLR
jgi:hypothetical protein